MHIGLVGRASGAVGPYLVGGIEVCGKHESVFAAEVVEAVGLHYREQAAVDSQDAVFVKVLGEPLGDGGTAHSVLLVHLKTAVGKLFFGLQKVA